MVLVVGLPGSGKTRLVSSLLPSLGKRGAEFQHKSEAIKNCNYARATYYTQSRVIVLGVYDGSPYAGTDKLGRNTQPAIIEMIQPLAALPEYTNWTILAEGDRITNPSFIAEMRKILDLEIVFLSVDAKICQARSAARTAERDADWLKTAPKKVANKPRRPDRIDGQSEVWFRTRLTKLVNILMENIDIFTETPNETEQQFDLALRELGAMLGVPVRVEATITS